MGKDEMQVNIDWDKLDSQDEIAEPSRKSQKKIPKEQGTTRKQKKRLESDQIPESEQPEEPLKLRKSRQVIQEADLVHIEDISVHHTASENKIMVEITYEPHEGDRGRINRQILDLFSKLE